MRLERLRQLTVNRFSIFSIIFATKSLFISVLSVYYKQIPLLQTNKGGGLLIFSIFADSPEAGRHSSASKLRHKAYFTMIARVSSSYNLWSLLFRCYNYFQIDDFGFCFDDCFFFVFGSDFVACWWATFILYIVKRNAFAWWYINLRSFLSRLLFFFPIYYVYQHIYYNMGYYRAYIIRILNIFFWLFWKLFSEHHGKNPHSLNSETQLLDMVSGATISNNVLSKFGNFALSSIWDFFFRDCVQESKIPHHLRFRGA